MNILAIARCSSTIFTFPLTRTKHHFLLTLSLLPAPEVSFCRPHHSIIFPASQSFLCSAAPARFNRPPTKISSQPKLPPFNRLHRHWSKQFPSWTFHFKETIPWKVVTFHHKHRHSRLRNQRNLPCRCSNKTRA